MLKKKSIGDDVILLADNRCYSQCRKAKKAAKRAKRKEDSKKFREAHELPTIIKNVRDLDRSAYSEGMPWRDQKKAALAAAKKFKKLSKQASDAKDKEILTLDTTPRSDNIKERGVILNSARMKFEATGKRELTPAVKKVLKTDFDFIYKKACNGMRRGQNTRITQPLNEDELKAVKLCPPEMHNY